MAGSLHSRSSSPEASLNSQSDMLPTAHAAPMSALRTSTSLAMPWSRLAVTGPTPHSASTGSFAETLRRVPARSRFRHLASATPKR
jgi:hypothetical protein